MRFPMHRLPYGRGSVRSGFWHDPLRSWRSGCTAANESRCFSGSWSESLATSLAGNNCSASMRMQVHYVAQCFFMTKKNGPRLRA